MPNVYVSDNNPCKGSQVTGAYCYCCVLFCGRRRARRLLTTNVVELTAHLGISSGTWWFVSINVKGVHDENLNNINC